MNEYLGITLIIFFSLIFRVLKEHIEFHNKNFFHERYTETNKFLSPYQCAHYIDCLCQKNLIVNNPLNENFAGTKGFVVEFNRDNIIPVFKDNNIYFMYDLISSLRKPYANKFILNMLIIPCKYHELRDRNSNFFTNFGIGAQIPKSVDFHYDTTISHNNDENTNVFNFSIVPECVSVIYISLPEEFKNGELLLYGFAGLVSKGLIKPELGKLVEFNGRLLHGVNETYIFKEGPQYRISIVLEQYCI